ncbi:NAD(P)H-dependent FMN reductase [Novosphingobium kunmingense]|uniref:NAD(P)H-dependent FMN reductase n=1 Tax=Novosphingobium kunmingense TaxID=1211806 RepID=A0A2N0H7L9_9SPHN|nr:NADPH-dependent FMN reductase [Novosphingobium kunmingense]PKB14931.1 NAD(P)H-dependent FMN reductase [Novosphingobium kunmingense]
MIRLVGITGSLRRASYNTALLNNIAELLPDGVSLEVRTLHGIPLYDGDEEAAHGIPAAVISLKEAIAAADGVVLATPEYNNGIPGVFKNAIDWISRPPGDAGRVFKGRPFALMGASPGGFGTILSQNHWLPVLRTLGVQLWTGGRLMVSRAGQIFDADGAISDPEMREQLRLYLAGFTDFMTKSPR